MMKQKCFQTCKKPLWRRTILMNTRHPTRIRTIGLPCENKEKNSRRLSVPYSTQRCLKSTVDDHMGAFAPAECRIMAKIRKCSPLHSLRDDDLRSLIMPRGERPIFRSLMYSPQNYLRYVRAQYLHTSDFHEQYVNKISRCPADREEGGWCCRGEC